MYELVQAAQNTYYINCPTKIGIYRVSDDNVWLIDSGNDKDAARKALHILEAKAWKATAILNTHSNADHMGGNEMTTRRTGCTVYSTPIENAIIQNTLLEPTILYGGYPPKLLRNKFLMAQSSIALDINKAELPEGMEIFPLPGHYLGMFGVKTPDDVYFLADSVFSAETLGKYHVTYVFDVKESLKTLDMLEGFQGKRCIPSHCEITEDICSLVAINRQNTNDIIGHLLKFCQDAHSFDEILQHVFHIYSLKMDMNQHVLVGSAIRSYLAYLMDEGKMAVEFNDSILRWHTL